ncbi:RMD1 family protein [Rhizorhapis suberifaciens]|uniref:Putative Rmd1/YagE family protein n=1 Tax=Rhizorhapis suberifaciens TaxID=13656 RepID=A0A840HR53_9SPHN|nr:RMD1 family protein [Rhizorhapis suberifaciens]MBB4640034.1 putative Rmd1/YagE family protein [Rhizorhapis suberifaciens]
MNIQKPVTTSSPVAARPPMVGVREVVGSSLGGPLKRAKVRAILVGERIDTRNLAGFVEPESLETEGLGAVFVFRYGVLVLFGAKDGIEQDLLERLKDHIIDPLDVPEIEKASVEIRPSADEQVDSSGHIILREGGIERLLLVATVLARSVVLARDESRIAQTFDRIEPLVTALRSRGRAGLPIRRVMQDIGEVLDARHRVVGRAQVGEKPDLLWDHPELDRLYARLEAEYELDERAEVIGAKLEVIGDTADALLNLVQDKRAVRLELAIIALIAFEVALTVYDRWLV